MTQCLAEPVPARPATQAAPRLWGLSARELHDAYWAGRGVQCVRRGVAGRLQRAAELFLLIEPDQLVLFNLAELAERLEWRNAQVTRLRVAATRGSEYGERLVCDEEGAVERVERRYRSRASVSYRVMLTPSPKIAASWMRAADRRGGWKRIRNRLSWSAVDHWRCVGEYFDEADHDAAALFLEQLVRRWPNPDQAIDGLHKTGDGVFSTSENGFTGDAVMVGPLWIGNDVVPANDACLIGPRVLIDKTGAAPDPDRRARVRAISEVTLAEAGSSSEEAAPGHWANSIAKRATDIVVSAVFLLLALPIFLLVPLLILFTDSRPIFFAHVRQARGGRTFNCWKFRTMVSNATAMTTELAEQNVCDGPQFFVENDPRVTRVGRYLRKWHIDELPQFWNVLRGHMSLVGPRPSPDAENQFCPAWRDLRLSVRPGITGLWQLKRTRERGTDFQEWIRYDIEYVRRASPWLDAVICFRTVWDVIFGRKSDASE